MSDETKHPERRAGQRTATGYGCTYGDKPGGPWCPAHDEGEDGWKLWNDGVSTGMKAGEALCPGHADAPPTPQPSAPVVACKAPEWCGFVQGDRKDPRRQRYIEDMSPNEGVYVGTHCYCSSACVPPLAAKPAEATACCDRGTLGCDAGYRDDGRLHSHRQFCKEQTRAKAAEQFKPAKGHDFSDPYCARRYEGAVVRLCVACGAFDVEGMRAPACEAKNWRPGYEGWLGGHEHGILRDPAIPERIVKPQMAHSMGIEDPALEDA